MPMGDMHFQENNRCGTFGASSYNKDSCKPTHQRHETSHPFNNKPSHQFSNILDQNIYTVRVAIPTIQQKSQHIG